MAEVRLNKFYTGISRDDYVMGAGEIVDGNSVDGLNTGYGITNGPKVSAQLLTNYLPRVIFGRETASNDTIAIGTNNGEIYKLTSTDTTPEYTLTNGWNVVNGGLIIGGSNYMYFISKDTSSTSTSCKIMQMTFTDFSSGTFTGVDESFLSFNNTGIPPVLLTDGPYLMVGGLGSVYRIDKDGNIETFSGFSRYVTGITQHGSSYYVYNDIGQVQIWDGLSDNVESRVELGFIVSQATSDRGFDHVITTDGDYYKGSGYNFILQTRATKSKRLENNVSYLDKFKFEVGNTISPAKGGVYMVGDSAIYRRQSLLSGMSEGFHKIVTKDFTNTTADISMIKYHSLEGRLYFGYNQGSAYGVNYIDLNSKETCEDGNFVTGIIRGFESKTNKIKKITYTAYNTGGDNYIKLYKRLENGSWDEIITINEATVVRGEIDTEAENFIDAQLKGEIHNDSQDENGPLLNNLIFEFTDDE